jgi:GAF domain-containing protein
MPALLVVCPKEAPSSTYVLREGASIVAGRDPECDLPLADRRVSARHARFDACEGVWRVLDLESRNGTSVNGVDVSEVELLSGDWLTFGGLPARFSVASEGEVEGLDRDRREKLDASHGMRRELQRQDETGGLLCTLIACAIEIASADRGFVLVQSREGTLHAVAEMPDSAVPRRDGFCGSRGAVARVLETGLPYITSDASADAYLGKRASVARMRLKAVACVPLLDGDRVMGVLYVDGKTEAPAFTWLDVEILEALAQTATRRLVGTRADMQPLELASMRTLERASGF